MAFRDQNGRITIDEDAADRDIKNITLAIEKLVNARSSLESIRQSNHEMKGLTGAAIEAKASELNNNLAALIQNLNDEIDRIRRTVSKYKEIDRLLAERIRRG